MTKRTQRGPRDVLRFVTREPTNPATLLPHGRERIPT